MLILGRFWVLMEYQKIKKNVISHQMGLLKKNNGSTERPWPLSHPSSWTHTHTHPTTPTSSGYRSTWLCIQMEGVEQKKKESKKTPTSNRQMTGIKFSNEPMTETSERKALGKHHDVKRSMCVQWLEQRVQAPLAVLGSFMSFLFTVSLFSWWKSGSVHN